MANHVFPKIKENVEWALLGILVILGPRLQYPILFYLLVDILISLLFISFNELWPENNATSPKEIREKDMRSGVFYNIIK